MSERAFRAQDIFLARTPELTAIQVPSTLDPVTAFFSRSAPLVVALALCAAARAEDAAPPAAPEKAAEPKAPSMAIEEDPAADEAVPPAPAGDERRLIGDYIRNHTREIRDCYEKRLQERKTLQGKLVARFDIGPSGRVIGATAEGMGDRELALCVVKVVRGWEFEKPQSGGKLRVGYPWVFTAAPSQ
jgi:outer membrane biosynthesis protein TonB